MWEKIQKAKILAIDTETTGLLFFDKVVGVSVAVSPDEGWYIEAKDFDKLKPLLQGKKLIFHHFVFDYVQLRKLGYVVENEYEDTKLMAYLLNPEQGTGLKALGIKYGCKNQKWDLKALLKQGRKKITFDQLDLNIASEYSSTDAKLTYELYSKVEEDLKKEGKVYQWYKAVELPLAKVLGDMIWEGIMIDTDRIRELSAKVGEDIEKLKKEIYQLAGEEFDINSPKQLAIVLFKKLLLPPIKTTKSGQFSTDTDTLQMLEDKHPIVPLILEYRKLHKLKSTYLDPLPEKVDENKRIHTFFHQTKTASGRLSSSSPNLQNIPRSGEMGEYLRSCFVAKQGYSFIVADYSQIELRVVAALSGEPKMYSAFLNGEDIHTQTSLEVFKKADKDTRSKAKIVNFGILYGMGVNSLAKLLKTSKTQAGKILKRYFQRYPRLADYIEEMAKEAECLGYVQTISGRKRYIPQLKSMSEQLRSFGKRIAINTPIQGSAADLMKIAMVQIYNELKANNLDAKILSQIHDELVIEVADEHLEKAEEIVRENLVKFKIFPVPKRLADIVEANVYVDKVWRKD